VALITGGASGIGFGIAERFALEGAVVVISDVQAELGTQVAADQGFIFIEQDVSNESRWLEVVLEVERRCGKLDILVNNAGILGDREAFTPENTSLANWKGVFSINVDGVFLGCRTAIPSMRRTGGGSIVNISSVAGLLATPYATAYGCSKAAVRQLTKSVAQYCAQVRSNIRCNSVHPGNVRTPLWDKQAQDAARTRGVSFEQVLAEGEALCPIGQLARPQDIAAAVTYLCSDEARHITGTKIIIDGGLIGCDSFHLPAPREPEKN